MKKLAVVFLTAALCVGSSACGGSAQSAAKDGSSVKTASEAVSSASEAAKPDSSAEESQAAEDSREESAASDASKAESAASDASKAESAASDASKAESAASEASKAESTKEESSSESAEEKPAGDESKAKSMVFDKEYEIVPWEYEAYEPTLLSSLEEGKVYEAPHCGDMTFLNDTEKNLIVYYESDNGVVGALPYACMVLDGLAIEDPVAYINDDDVVRVRVEEINLGTLARDTDGVIFVDTLKKGKKIRFIGKYMLVNGGSEEVSVEYPDMEGNEMIITLQPGDILGFEWMSVDGTMRIADQ